nr:hypothetical protein [Candidatus Megaera polyxenophila]
MSLIKVVIEILEYSGTSDHIFKLEKSFLLSRHFYVIYLTIGNI